MPSPGCSQEDTLNKAVLLVKNYVQYLVLGRASIGASGINKWMGSWMDGQTDGRKGEGRKEGLGGREGRKEVKLNGSFVNGMMDK